MIALAFVLMLLGFERAACGAEPAPEVKSGGLGGWRSVKTGREHKLDTTGGNSARGSDCGG